MNSFISSVCAAILVCCFFNMILLKAHYSYHEMKWQNEGLQWNKLLHVGPECVIFIEYFMVILLKIFQI